MIKTVISGAITMALFSSLAHASQGQGVVNFKGTVIEAPCGIAPDSVDQTIDFGQLSKSHLESGGISIKKNLDIKLVHCSAAELAKKGVVKVTFTGAFISNKTDELGTSGNTGTAVVISNPDGSFVKFDNTESIAHKLKPGDNTLRYSTWVKKVTGGTLNEGDFVAVANFNLTYN